MQPDPSDYDVTPEILRKRMNLPSWAKIWQTGIEFQFDEEIRKGLVECYDQAALLLRTFPDFTIKINDQVQFVEAKEKTTSIEAIGLYYNKLRERFGAPVWYVFPNVVIRASLIPMETIEIPLKHRMHFDRFLKTLFEEENCIFNYWSSDPKNGSGDPFVRIEEVDLKILSEGS